LESGATGRMEVIVNVKIIILVSNQILKTIHLIEDKTDVN